MELQNMTVREKALQTVCLRMKAGQFNPEKVGAAFFFGEIITDATDIGLDVARRALKEYTDNADIPLLVTSDFENGCGSMLKGLTPFTYMMGLGATDSEEIAYNYGLATAKEARSVGANWSFSPVCDLNLNPRNPLIGVRGMTDDAELACRLLGSVIKGMQDGGLAACAKHFPGDGVDYRDQHIVPTCNSLSMEEWWQNHGKVFKHLIDSGVLSIMPGHISLPAYQKERAANGMCLPATLSKELITDLLKGELGFKGVVVTDALGMGGFTGWYESQRRAEIESFKAGCDMMLWPNEHYVDDLCEAIERGYISMERLDDAVERILAMKRKLGLFERDNAPVLLTEADEQFVAQACKAAAEGSITLVRDRVGRLPLSPEKTKKIALTPITHHAPALEEAELLKKRLEEKGFTVDYYPEKAPSGAQAEEYDLLLYALFSRPFRPIGYLDFMADEARKIWRASKNAPQKSMMISFGSPYHANQYFERCDTVINAYSMVSCSVEAAVKAITGEIPFMGKSPVKL